MAENEKKRNEKNSIFNKIDFMGLDVTYEEAKAVIFPAPYSSSPLTHGTLNAPFEILNNWNLEDYDIELNYSPCTAKIYPLPEWLYEGENGLTEIYNETKQILKDGKYPIVLGGDQTISLATIKAASEIYEELSVVIFDAHADMKDSFENQKNSNLCVTKRLMEMGVDIVQIGVRSIGSEELEEAEKVDAYYKVSDKEMSQIVKRLNHNVYISIDVDVFDPSIMPATTMPEPCGFNWEEITSQLEKIANKKHLVGCDITELSPIPGFNAPNVLCAQLAYKAIGIRFKKQAEEEKWENCYEEIIKQKKTVN